MGFLYFIRAGFADRLGLLFFRGPNKVITKQIFRSQCLKKYSPCMKLLFIYRFAHLCTFLQKQKFPILDQCLVIYFFQKGISRNFFFFDFQQIFICGGDLADPEKNIYIYIY